MVLGQPRELLTWRNDPSQLLNGVVASSRVSASMSCLRPCDPPVQAGMRTFEYGRGGGRG